MVAITALLAKYLQVSNIRSYLIKYLRLFGITVPITVLRNVLFGSTFFITYVFILLPLSTLTYVKFYNTLIPNTGPSIPIHYQSFNSNNNHSLIGFNSDWIILQENLPRKFKFDPLLQYQINVKFDVLCDSTKRGDVYKNSYSIISENDKVLVSHEFYIDCDARYIYNNNNWLIPYNLRFWSPPPLVNIKRSIGFNLAHLRLTGNQLPKEFKNFTIVLENPFIVIQDTSKLEFEIIYTGFRYYLVKHYYKCFVVGVVFFWYISCVSSFITSVYLSSQQKQQQTQQKQQQTQQKQKQKQKQKQEDDDTGETETESEDHESVSGFSSST
ncbi:uncharacterized protein RJT21DRAFT_123101 [Scheffersomyces amazonensis]|uniref:uncharacterized protein n=1 Tax=Scheffersomyces amazonensis TaxID=1078765 RepID=UPI00315D544F